jgi:secreted Zn-dependent insulinase-like peptidase
MTAHATLYQSGALYDLALSYRDFDKEAKVLMTRNHRADFARRLLRLLWLTLATGGAPLSLLQAAPAHAAFGCEENAESYRLDNGLEVVLLEDRQAPLVTVVSAVSVGSRHSPRGYEGLAHYVEHLAFRGNFGFTPYEEAGATSYNAYTAADETVYHVQLESAQLERALWLEARRFAVGLAEVDEESAREELEVVLQEHQQRGRGYGRTIYGAALSHGFPDGHPYHDLVAPQESQERLTLANARWFHEQTYVAERTRLVIAGDFDPQRARSFVAKYWAGIRAHAPPSGASPEALAPMGPLLHTLESDAEACKLAAQEPVKLPKRMRVRMGKHHKHLEVWWPLPISQDPSRAAYVLSLWAEGMRDPLVEKGWALGVGATIHDFSLASFVALSIDATSSAQVDELEALLWQRLEEFKRSGAQDLERDNIWKREAQRVELASALRRRGTLGRAHRLATRRCVVHECRVNEAPSPEEVVEVLPYFAKEHAMVVESVNQQSAEEVEVIQ